MDKTIRNFWIGLFGFTLLILLFNAWILDFYKADGIRRIPIYIIEIIIFLIGGLAGRWHYKYIISQWE